MMMIRRRRMVILTCSSLFLCDVKNNSTEKHQIQKYEILDTKVFTPYEKTIKESYMSADWRSNLSLDKHFPIEPSTSSIGLNIMINHEPLTDS